MRIAVSFILVFMALSGFSQKKAAYVSGKVIDENENPLPGVSITILGKEKGIVTSDSGTYRIKVPAEKAFALIFSFTGYRDEQKNFYLSESEEEQLTVKLDRSGKTLQAVIINNQKERTETGLVKINPKSTTTLPSATGGVEALIKILVGSNNELTSQYSVRGGNYDENLIYINDFEIYRPFLVSNAQQEGLSFINPELAKNISFYNGGFQAKYGDKISSVLDIQYKKPTTFGGSAYVSLLEQGFHFEGSSKNQKLTWLFGVRSKTNKDLLSSQEVKGNYVPSALDLQAFITYKLSNKLQLELLGILSGSKFTLIPESAQKSTAVFSPLFTADLALNIFFDGQEKDNYNTNLVGLSLNQVVNKRVKLKWMASHYGDNEKENYDITGAYFFGERDFDKTSSSYGQIVNPLGAGVYQNYARNSLNIDVYNISHKGNFDIGKHFIQWGAGVDHTIIREKLNEWEYQDSAEYSLPYNPNVLNLSRVLKSSTNLSIDKYSGYVQDNIRLGDSVRDVTLQVGARFNYNSLNHEFLVSPRAQLSYKPNWKKDIVLKAAAGIYDQPPFYREMRRYDGTVNTALKSQKSAQFVAGFDYNLSSGDRPMRITTEAYYKSLTDVDVYDIDNVRIQYYGNNNAKAYATGIETRIFTDLVKDAESWFSIGLSSTKENLNNDFYYTYKNAAGEIITSQATDQVVADSLKNNVGYVRRPTDRLLTLGLFLQDYLSTNKNFRVHLNLIYGSNMPYNIPNNVRYRNALIIEPYIRADIGFSALLLSEKSLRRSHSPFRSFDNIWASLEVFNLIDRANTISYQLIKDFANDTFSIPNRLTPRLINFKLLARF
ncbi:TonB-dependent receptor [Ginsengibacter hankyongi]|uniref:TonB-dependent receptor n=1 Tax=Ginsengibacter hankyongi TaxID=2607284 RepID=A0A5J5IF17_9BACT|nr:TonB-dependent receptor [Ginsengibacter hankyongi]KAA9037670.1 TonB-dependent receptor [Ginsengibacter hankyongi]